MHIAVPHSGTSAQVTRVAQALSAIGEVPGATIMIPVLVTSGTTQISLEAHAFIGRIVENLLPEQDLSRHRLRGHGGDRRHRRLSKLAFLESLAQVVYHPGSLHQVLNEKLILSSGKTTKSTG